MRIAGFPRHPQRAFRKFEYSRTVKSSREFFAEGNLSESLINEIFRATAREPCGNFQGGRRQTTRADFEIIRRPDALTSILFFLLSLIA